MGMAEHFGPWFCGLGKLTGNCARQAAAMKWKRRRRLSFVRSFFSDLGSSGKRIRSASLSLLGGGGGGHPATDADGRIGTNERTMEGARARTLARSLARSLGVFCGVTRYARVGSLFSAVVVVVLLFCVFICAVTSLHVGEMRKLLPTPIDVHGQISSIGFLFPFLFLLSTSRLMGQLGSRPPPLPSASSASLNYTVSLSYSLSV